MRPWSEWAPLSRITHQLHIYAQSQNPSKPNIAAASNDFRHRNAFANSAALPHSWCKGQIQGIRKSHVFSRIETVPSLFANIRTVFRDIRLTALLASR